MLIAAGSGITPMLSIAASVLAAHRESTVTLLYGNRRTDTVMFADELADLKDRYPARLRWCTCCRREPREAELFTGRLDADKLRTLLPVTVDVAEVDHWWLCGPFGMVTDAVAVLAELGRAARSGSTGSCSTSRTSRRRRSGHDDAPRRPGRRGDRGPRRPGHHGDRAAGRAGPRRRAARPPRPAVRLQGRGVRHLPGPGHRRRGDMRRNFALEEAEVDAGYVLTCQSVAASSQVTVDYDS